MSNFIGNFWWLIFMVVGGGLFGLRQYYQTDAGRYQIDKIMLKTPILGLLLRKIAVARFCRTLGTLLSSGVAILEALEITARTSGNAVIEEALFKVRKEVEEGKTIAEPLTRSEQFPPMVCQMIGVGEQTGAMDTMLNKIADFYEDEVDAAVDGMMALIEPVIIAVLGVVIGTIVVAMYLPMFTLISQIG
jgi:type IV pilus assembly protein PilC